MVLETHICQDAARCYVEVFPLADPVLLCASLIRSLDTLEPIQPMSWYFLPLTPPLLTPCDEVAMISVQLYK